MLTAVITQYFPSLWIFSYFLNVANIKECLIMVQFDNIKKEKQIRKQKRMKQKTPHQLYQKRPLSRPPLKPLCQWRTTRVRGKILDWKPCTPSSRKCQSTRFINAPSEAFVCNVNILDWLITLCSELEYGGSKVCNYSFVEGKCMPSSLHMTNIESNPVGLIVAIEKSLIASLFYVIALLCKE